MTHLFFSLPFCTPLPVISLFFSITNQFMSFLPDDDVTTNDEINKKIQQRQIMEIEFPINS